VKFERFSEVAYCAPRFFSEKIFDDNQGIFVFLFRIRYDTGIMIYTLNIEKAIKFAAKTHNHYQEQKRKGKKIPYISHPLTAGIILALAGASEDVIVAGILHDTIEDSIDEKKVTPAMLEERFGVAVRDLVLSVTEEDKTLSWTERKASALSHIEHFSEDSALVKSADVLSNGRELVDDHGRHGDEVFKRFVASKEDTLANTQRVIEALLRRFPESPLAEDLRILGQALVQIRQG
jgi:(p)ppGpp synthase/HD superfamily hydrolase